MHALWSTLKVALIALGLATMIGSLVAFLFVQNKLIERSFFPYAVILQVTPIVAIAPLIIILVKNTQIALIICATIIAVFPIISNTTIGLRSIDSGHQNLFCHQSRHATAEPHLSAHSERVAVFLCRLEDRRRPFADRRRGGRIRRRHRRTQRRPRL